MEGLKFDVTAAEQALVMAKAVQQLTLGEPAATLAEGWNCGGYALCIGPDAIATRGFPVTFHFALLTQYARKHPRWLRSLWKRAIHGCQRRGRGASLWR